MPSDAPEPVRKRRSFSWVWAVPLAALVAVAWLAFEDLVREGPAIEITWERADGLVAGQTKVLYKNVQIGEVESIALARDLSHVAVTVDMTRLATPYLLDDTQFWVVRPRLALGQNAGIDTLISGSYIAMEPGKGAPRRRFAGREDQPLIVPDSPGHAYNLVTDNLESLAQGAPVYFHGLPAGEVLGYELTPDGRNVQVHIFIAAPYDKQVHDQTRFWNVSGIRISAGAEGVQIRTHTLQSVLAGGIDFDMPAGQTPSPVMADRVFPLYPDEEAARDFSDGAKILFAAAFPDSLDGVVAGTVVTLQGVPVGHVESVKLAADPDGSVHVPVVFDLEPDRLFGHPVVAGDTPEGRRDTDALIARMVARGLRARLQAGNLLTGQRTISLEFDPAAPPEGLEYEGGMARIPTEAGSSIAGIEQSAQTFVDKLAALPLQEMVTDIRTTFRSANATLNSPHLARSLRSLDTALANITVTTKDQLPALMTSLRSASDAADAAIAGEQGKSGLGDAMEELTEAARSLRLLSDYLEQHPESLLRGKRAEN